MKTKKVNKKLSLNKKTVSNLSKIEMEKVYGAADITTFPLTVRRTECLSGCNTSCPECIP